ncbi:caspase family protein [Microvirga sp. 2YAF29]|uniref:caspase family protein n=1 Tax=Microvirga sp. 2YAF29 TaxID=3233031 RepID=UPI003F9A24B1
MKRAIVFAAFVLATIAGSTSFASAQQQRLALVVGQSAYERNPLATAANDAGLIAQTLTSAGFEVIQGRDLNATDLRRVVRDFLDKAQELEKDSAIVVYLSGYGVQLEGENYLLPVDARIQRDADVPIEGFRLSDLVRSLQQAPAQTRIIIGDMGRDYPFPPGGEPIARGLALMEPPAGFLMAFSSAPNITAPDGQGPYGAYVTALAEMMRQPGVPVDEVFNRVRLRTHEATKGVQTPWDALNLGNTTFVFFEPNESAAAPLVREVRRIEDVPAEEAYSIAVERDTIQDYQAFLRRYPDHPLAKRVSALLAARREAIVWRRTLNRNTSEAYWTYLRSYPKGPHAADSRRRLARLSAPIAPPQVFEEVVYDDLPPPLPMVERIEVVEVVTIIRDAPPPPRPPVYLLPDYEEDVEFVEIIREPPPPPILVGVLPIPAPFPVPRYARPPREYYQPIAPITPRGMVAIPVARPPVLMDRPGAPRPPRGERPEPRIPRQPGLVGTPQPIPVVARPPEARPGVRPGAPVPQAPTQPRLPRPIPLAADGGAARPGRSDIQPAAPARPSPVAPAPGVAPGLPQPARPSAIQPQGNEAPVARPRPSADENRPAPRPQRPGVDEGQPMPRPGRPSMDESRPSPRPMRPSVEESRPAPRPGRPSADENRPAPRPMRPGVDEGRAAPRFEAPRPAQPAPQIRQAPQQREIAPRPGREFDARPAPRMERPAPPPMMRQPAPPAARPAPAPAPAIRPQAPRPSREGQRPDCRPGRPCANEQR